MCIGKDVSGPVVDVTHHQETPDCVDAWVCHDVRVTGPRAMVYPIRDSGKQESHEEEERKSEEQR